MGKPKIPGKDTFKRKNESPFKRPDFGHFTPFEKDHEMVLDGKTVGRKVRSCPVDSDNRTIYAE